MSEVGPAQVAGLVAALRGQDVDAVREAARALKKLAEERPELLTAHAKELVRAAAEREGPLADVRTRWQLTIVLGAVPLVGRDRLAAVDILWEQLQDSSALQRTFAMQALFDLSAGDADLRRRVRVVLREFAESGTAAMRARARKLLKADGSYGKST